MKKKLISEQISNTRPTPDQPFYATCDVFTFGVGAAFLQSHQGTNRKNLKPANSKLLVQAE